MIALTVMFTVLLQSLPKLLLFYQRQNNGIYGTLCYINKTDEVTEDTVNNLESLLDTLNCNFSPITEEKSTKEI